MANIDKQKALEVVKDGVKFVIYSSTGALGCGIMRALVPPGVNAIVKGGMLLGGFFLSEFMSDKISEHADKQIDGIVDNVKESIDQAKRDLDVLQDKDIEKNDE